MTSQYKCTCYKKVSKLIREYTSTYNIKKDQDHSLTHSNQDSNQYDAPTTMHHCGVGEVIIETVGTHKKSKLGRFYSFAEFITIMLLNVYIIKQKTIKKQVYRIYMFELINTLLSLHQ